MKQSSLLFSVFMAVFLIAGRSHAADQTNGMFAGVQQILLLSKGDAKKDQIVINDPGKIKQMVDLLKLEKSDRLACDMEWQMTFIKKAGKIEMYVCKHCIEMSGKNGTERFQTPSEFYKLVQQSEKTK